MEELTYTSYFHVKDENKFLNLMRKVYTSGYNERLAILTTHEADGDKTFSLNCIGAVCGLIDMDDAGYDDFISKLQECVRDDDKIVITYSYSGTNSSSPPTHVIEYITSKSYTRQTEVDIKR